ncbi:MAG TPA: ABC transporter permease [Stellaceae bacterium]|nr:ABC transporter permease [Stellaceae bacterium]
MIALDAAAPRARVAPRNQVLLALVLVAVLAAAGAGFVSAAPNRLVSGTAVTLKQCAPPLSTAALTVLGLLLLALAFAPPTRWRDYLAAGLAGGALIATLAAAGAAAAALAVGAGATTTISLGAAVWAVFACAALALIDALRRAAIGPAAQLLAAALAVATFLAMAKTGWFDALSLAREYAGRRDVFAAAAVRHVALVAGSIAPALLAGVPLGLLAHRRPRLEAPIFTTLNLVQTVPSIALFGLLIEPLSGLASTLPLLGRMGVGGVGPAPAVIALTLYGLLPIARNALAGLASVAPAALDAGRGMGMTRGQLFRRLEVPLALPVLLAGLRIVLVQTIGLAVVAALIGAGGLGTFVFDGLGQYATDLVLLGALPAIAMALAADFLLRLATGAVMRRAVP